MNGAADARPVAPSSGRLRPLSLAEVEITDGFWGDRQQVNSEATIALSRLDGAAGLGRKLHSGGRRETP
jgi:hypothetical protein